MSIIGTVAPYHTRPRVVLTELADLAGSEKHTSSKERNVEGRHINQSSVHSKLIRSSY